MYGPIGFRHVVSHTKSYRWRAIVRTRRDDLHTSAGHLIQGSFCTRGHDCRACGGEHVLNRACTDVCKSSLRRIGRIVNSLRLQGSEG
jgi:hypothetical protein